MRGSEGSAIRLQFHPPGNGGRDSSTNGVDARRPIGINGVRHENHVSIAGRVHPDGGPGESRVTERAHGEELAAIAGERRLDIPAQSAQRCAGSRLAGRGHLFERKLLERESAGPAGKPIQQVLGVDGNVIRSAEESRVPGNAAHAPGSWIMHQPAKHDSMFVLRGCDTAMPAFWRKKSHVLHAQRLGEIASLIFIQGEAGEFFDQRTQHDEVDIAVAELHAGSRDRGSRKRAPQSLFFA